MCIADLGVVPHSSECPVRRLAFQNTLGCAIGIVISIPVDAQSTERTGGPERGTWGAEASINGGPAPTAPRFEIGAVALGPRWGATDILGGVEGMYLVAQRGAAGVEAGGALLRAFPDQSTDICVLTPRPGDVCDLRAVDRVAVANAGLRLTGRAGKRLQFIARAGPSLYAARVVENYKPTGDYTSGIMLGSSVGIGGRVARYLVVFQLRASTIPDALGERGSLYGMSLGIGF